MTEINYKTEWYQDFKPDFKIFDVGIEGFWRMKYTDRWQLLSDLASKEFFEPRKVLDIGCGMGRALSWFKLFGANVFGVEPSEYASGIAKDRGLNVINDYFENTDIQDTFDVIHIEQVLSHAPEYKKILSKAKRLLNPNGILVIEEPNDNNILQRLLEATKGRYWETVDHCNYFNFSNFDPEGFKLIKKSATYPMEFFELMGEGYIGEEEKGREVHRKRYELESSLPYNLRQDLHEAFAKLGIGRDMVMFYRGEQWKD